MSGALFAGVGAGNRPTGQRLASLVAFGALHASALGVAKLGLIIYMAKMLDDRRRHMSNLVSGVFRRW